MAHEDDGDLSPEQKNFNKKRQEATTVIRKRMLSTYLEILLKSNANEQHRFAPLIDWAIRIFKYDDLIDLFEVSGATLKRWAAGKTYPGPLACSAVLRRLRTLVIHECDT